MIIDTHFHYPSMLKRDKNVTLSEDLVGLEIGLDGGDLKDRIEKIGNNKNIFLSVGAGPWVLDRKDFISIDNELLLVEEDILKYNADALGEIGFDNHWKYGTKEKQQELFERSVLLARKYKLAVSIHSRDADNELLLTAKNGYIDDKTILHCFSSDKDICKTLLDNGAYISFAGNITYKDNIKIQESAKYTPLDRILVETDSPYLSPIPLRGKPNNPMNTEIILEFISQIKEVDKEELKENVINNFYLLMGANESKVKRDISTVER